MPEVLEDIWEEVEEAVHDAISNGEGRVYASYLKFAFIQAGLKVHRETEQCPVL